MAKRFTATDKWRKQFMKGLSTVHKLLWLYILDECDHAGIWDVELDIASIRVGEDVTGITPEDFGGKVVVLDGGGKWFIPDFIGYQYGQLNDKVNAHKSAIARLNSQLSKKQIQQFMNPSRSVKDKDKDKDKEEKERLWDIWYGIYDKKVDKQDAKKVWMRLKIEDMEKAIDVAPKYVALTPDPKYRKGPASYLRQKKFDDELPEPNQEHIDGPKVKCSDCGTVKPFLRGYTTCTCGGSLNVC